MSMQCGRVFVFTSNISSATLLLQWPHYMYLYENLHACLELNKSASLSFSLRDEATQAVCKVLHLSMHASMEMDRIHRHHAMSVNGKKWDKDCHFCTTSRLNSETPSKHLNNRAIGYIALEYRFNNTP